MLEVEKIRKVIEEDAQIACQYIDDEGNTCFIGGLLLASGKFTVESLREYMAETDWMYERNRMPIPRLNKALEVLEQTYGINPWQAHELQRANDSHRSRKERQKHLRRVLKELAS